jgi:hypothetical protein
MPVPPPAEDILSFPKEGDHARYGGAVAAVVITVLLFVATIGGVYYWYTRYYIKSYGDNLGLMGRNFGAMGRDTEGNAQVDEIPTRGMVGGGGRGGAVEFGTANRGRL